MSSEALTGTTRNANAWQRFLAWVQAFEAAMDTSYDEIQDRRLLALEREVAELKAKLGDPRLAGNPAGRASTLTDA